MSSQRIQADAVDETSALISEVVGGIEAGEIPLRIYNDPEIHQLELERIFGRTWVFVGHETEIPSPGDYVRRTIGEDPFILVRNEDGEVRLFFNSCRHRGTQLCQEDRGNTSHFRCPYHGWAYNTKGDLVGVPDKERVYKDMDFDEWGLYEVPRLEEFHGLIFASLAEEGPSLEEYIGDFSWILETVVNLFKSGWEVIGEPHRWMLDTNWKSGPENSSGDSYHTQIAHKSLSEAGFQDEAWFIGARTNRYVSVDGHSAIYGLYDDVNEIPGSTTFSVFEEAIIDDLNTDLSDEQLSLVERSSFSTPTVFPNLMVNRQTSKFSKDSEPVGYLNIRQWQPRGPNKTEEIHWMLAPRVASEEYKERVAKTAMIYNSPTGSSEADDIRIWEGIADSAGSLVAEQKGLKLNYKMGKPGISDIPMDETWPGPGEASIVYDDRYAWTFFNSWCEHMQSDQ